MIKTEEFEASGIPFIRTYSDAGFKIHGGVPEGDYSEACDPAEFGRTYTETDIPIESDDDAERALEILLGGEQ